VFTITLLNAQVHDNQPAVKLYQSLGFEMETEESEGFAKALDRPRRQLFYKRLQEA
jgi:ribosomal protein S18 acetylase RimI-like enzyme